MRSIPSVIVTPSDLSCDHIVHKVLASFDTYGCDVIKLVIPTPFHVFCTRNPEHIKHVTTCRESATNKPPHTVPKADWVMGNGVFNDLGGDSWKAKRLQLNAAFTPQHSRFLCEFFPQFLEKLKLRWTSRKGEILDLHDELLRMVLDFAMFAMFSKRLADNELEWITGAVEFCEEMFATISPLWLPTSSNLKLRKVGHEFNRLMQKVLKEWRPDCGHSDVISLLTANGCQISDDNARAAMFSSLLGAPAAALPILWAVYVFTIMPDTLQRIRAELFQVVGTRVPNPADLSNLKYLDSFYNELLRLYPPFWGSLRYSKERINIDGYSFPPRSIFAMMRAAAHKHPHHWQEPEKFIPERFRANADSGSRRAYIPFGWGPRVCLGRHLAGLMCPIAIAFIAQNFDCEVLDVKNMLDFKYWFAMYPAQKLLATVRPLPASDYPSVQ